MNPKILFSFLVLVGVSCLDTHKDMLIPKSTVPPVSPLSTEYVPTSSVDFTCWSIQPLTPRNGLKGGFIFSQNLSVYSDVDSFFVWDIDSFQSQEINHYASEQRTINNVHISFGGESVAFLIDNTIVISSYKKTQNFFLPNQNLSLVSYLFDGRVLLIDQEARKVNYVKNVGLTDSYYIFDPTTGEIDDYTVFLPNFVTGKRNSYTVLYSPDMKHVIYRSGNRDDIDEFTLYNLSTGQILWIGPPRDVNLIYQSDSAPGWQNITSITALYMNTLTRQVGYYLISLDGQLTPITNLSGIELSNTTQPIPSTWSYTSEIPNWSPDGRYLISTGRQSNNQPGSSLYIWDNVRKQGYKPCFPDEENRVFPHRIYWSPNNAYLVVSLAFVSNSSTQSNEINYSFRSYILDLIEKQIYEVPISNSAYNNFPAGFHGWVNWEIP